MRHNIKIQDLFKDNSTNLLGEDSILVIPNRRNRGGSTDMGDLSQMIPSCHPYTTGAEGPGHSKDYIITNYQTAVINPAKVMAMVAIDLLAEGATRGKEVVETYRPTMRKSAYLNFQRERAQVFEFDGAE